MFNWIRFVNLIRFITRFIYGDFRIIATLDTTRVATTDNPPKNNYSEMKTCSFETLENNIWITSGENTHDLFFEFFENLFFMQQNKKYHLSIWTDLSDQTWQTPNQLV